MLEGKTALVAGSTSGFGDVDGPKAEVAALGVKVTYHGADMSKPAEIVDMMRFAGAQFGRVDILVNNAGKNPRCNSPHPKSWAHWHCSSAQRRATMCAASPGTWTAAGPLNSFIDWTINFASRAFQ
jgi:NAD(P)-dependent dehydrogenase (short-subunit alcohol dehydrogenase family)